MVYKSFHILLDLTCSYSVKDFCLYVYERHVSVAFRSFMFLSDFAVSGMLDSQTKSGSIPSAPISGTECRELASFFLGLVLSVSEDY